MVNRKKKDIFSLLLFVSGIILINILSSNYFTRFDFTKEKRYTLSDITKNMLGNLEHNLEITVYLEGDFPAGFKKLQSSTRDLLNDYRAYSNGKLHFKFINPLQGDQHQQETVYNELLSKGIEPTQIGVPKDGGVSQIIVYPSALITCAGKEIAVRLSPYTSETINQTVINSSVENLEYAFTSAIKRVLSKGKPLVAFTEGHGELTDLQLYDAMQSLQDGYEVRRVNLSNITIAGLNKLKLLIIPKPSSPFTEAEKYKIDYFVMRGGRIVWAIDQVNAELDSLRGRGQQLTFPMELNLEDILFNYGVRINNDLIADMNCAQIPIKVGDINGQPQMQLLPWLYYPIFVSQSNHPLVKNLDGVRSEFASTVDTIGIQGVKKQFILSSSPFSRILPSPAVISLKMVEQEADPRAFRNVSLPVAVLLEGSFPSAFRNRPVPEGIKDVPEFLGKGQFAKMLVIGDGDVLKNQVNASDGSPFPLGYDRYMQKQFGNRNFLLNIADYLTDDSGIIELRTKEIKVRLLDRPRIRSEKLFWQMLNIGLPLMLIIFSGIFQHYFRKRKYGRVK